ncbi:MAG: OadG family protein [Motiliproteus sp.]
MMESSDLINEGLTLMVFGMGFVFVFLTLLVFVTGLMSRFVERYLPEPVSAAPAAAPAPVTATDDGQLVAVISAAIKQYRSRHPR